MAAPANRAQRSGNVDGIVAATLRKSHDPTSGFIKRTELVESERTDYVKAYESAYVKAVRS